jgi:hypothetical protein
LYQSIYRHKSAPGLTLVNQNKKPIDIFNIGGIERGLGMFVTKGTVEILRNKRKEEFYDNYVSKLVTEAKRLNFSKEDIIKMVERGFFIVSAGC